MAFQPATAATSSFTFYDIESLSNVFSLVAYTPRPEGIADTLEIFHLVDDDALDAAIVEADLVRAVKEQNPGLPGVNVVRRDLRTEMANLRLAQLFGVSDADQVCDPLSSSSFPAAMRPVCDTDEDYDPALHPFLAGYNSMNYDTVMLSLYLSEVFAGFALSLKESEAAGSRLEQLESRRRSLQLVGAGAGGRSVPHADLAEMDDRIAAQQELLVSLRTRYPHFSPVTAASMRGHNDALFSEQYIDYMPKYLGYSSTEGRIRASMLRSGRHLDVARLNEAQYTVGLKRLLGMLGHQIKESEKLGHDSVITTAEELYELLAYNVADCLGLSQLFEHPTYSGGFDLKAGLLAQYDDTRFYTRGGRRTTVRRDRLSVDSTSAKFVSRILSPKGSLVDDETVTLVYPHPEEAALQGVESINVLDMAVRFFEEEVAPDPEGNPAHAAAREQFDQVVRFYRSIEGQNFNDSEGYRTAYPDGPQARMLREIPKLPNNIPYFRADGTPTSCFVTFSTGGIHGAEANLAVLEAEQEEQDRQIEMIALASMLFPDAKDFVAEAKRQHGLLTLPDGSTVDKAAVLIGSDPEKVRYRKPSAKDPQQAELLARAQAAVPDPAELLATQRPKEMALDVVMADSSVPGGQRVLVGKTVLANTTAAKAAYREEPARKIPDLFTAKADGSTKLHPKFARTSAGLVVHEDFTSYYPNLLRNMRAFWNPELGEDRYATIFFEKERLGDELKQPGLSGEEKARLKTLRNGTKLILNSASGAGDASHDTPIRMNNRIIAMRIMGQLFSWLIGQAQSLSGARIISTNTDGLYSVVGEEGGIDEATNNRVLAERSRSINIDIEPETMFLISKDSNNRLELEAPAEGSTSVADSTILAAGGGTLACYAGPNPTKSLAHPAVIDRGLARYLQTVASRGEQALSEDYDTALGARLIQEALEDVDPIKSLLLFQNVLAASRGSITYPFAFDPFEKGEFPADVNAPRALHEAAPRPLQMINRTFIVKPGTPGAVSLMAAGAWKVPAASQQRRAANGEVATDRRHVAIEILRHHGWGTTTADRRAGLTPVPADQDVLIRKISGIDPTWSMLIVNEDLHTLSPQRIAQLQESLDLEVYTQILGETFTDNWKNTAA